MSLMVDFNQGLHFGEALERCHAIDDLGLAWIEEPIVPDYVPGNIMKSVFRSPARRTSLSAKIR